MTAQNQDPVFKERARVGSRRAGVSAHRKDREAYFARVRAFLINSLGTLPPAVPSQDVLRIAAKIYRHAYNLGYHVGYNREWRQAHPNYWLRRDDV